MRWLPYFILAYIMLGLQVGIGRFLAFHGAAPNLALLAVVFISLNAPRDAALLGSFGIGLMQDLLTAQQPGLYAFSYGLVALFVVALHQAINGNHPVAHFVLVLIGGLITLFVLLTHSLIHPAAPALVEDGKRILGPVRISAGVELTRVFYTALLAPIVLFALGRIRGVFSFQPGKNRTRQWSR